MSAFYCSSVFDFLNTTDDAVLSQLGLAHAQHGYTSLFSDQTITWSNDLGHLRRALTGLCVVRPCSAAWWITFEFVIPRKERRIDVVLLTRTRIVLIECKRTSVDGQAFDQVENYALLLHYFHKPSNRRQILPVVVSGSVPPKKRENAQFRSAQRELEFDTLASYWIAPTRIESWASLHSFLASIDEDSTEPINGAGWVSGPYFPVPTIIEAARQLRTGLKIREIAHSEAAEHDIELVTAEIDRIISLARVNRKHTICFLTGVPGSGKTLVGLSLAHLGESREDAVHFMSGNGPLVAVLQENFRRQAMRDGVPAPQAKIQAETLIENIHVFARTYTDDKEKRAPSNHVIVFDEAQRAWNLQQNRSKFGRHYSEPEMLLSLMGRHEDWAVVIALVGGGQEINSGEAGLEEWGRALSASLKEWIVYASPEVLDGGASTAGHVLFPEGVPGRRIEQCPLLHLRTSNRSIRADTLASWVNAVIAGDASGARALDITRRFPLFLSRSLEQTRKHLSIEALGESRYGLVGSSAAQRLRAEGLEPSSSFHAEYPWHHWYLSPKSDVRSSYQCEVFATEFEIQGLELDWIGLCWGGDFIWDGESWRERDLRYTDPTRWGLIGRQERQNYRRNAYRVLLTRARQGMILFVPQGDASDPTRNPEEFDRTAAFLQECGVSGLHS